ncbi:MAG: hypothetical protein D6796_09045 [Caldilineae bacterium]|nr:MAG: hypothetical protein D6796_09045 [Caldilineae bacterium]
MEEIRQALKRERTHLQAGQMIRAKRGQITDYDELDRIASAEQQAAEIQLKKTPPLKLFWTIGLFARDQEELDELSKRLEELLRHAEIRAHRALFRQEEGLHSLLPLGINTLGDWRNIDVPAMGQMFPFLHTTLLEPEGVPYGIDRTTGAWVVVDDFDQGNPNTIILGEMGSGKSMFLKMRAAWFTLLGGRVYCLDLEGEFDGLAEALDGVCLDFGLGQSENQLNVIGINSKSGNGFIEGMEDLLSWIALAAGELDPAERNEVIDAWQRMMYEAGITQNDPQTWTRPMPRLSDLYAVLSAELKPAAQSIAERIKQYAVGIYAGAFDTRTNIDVDNNLVVFNLRDVRDPRMKALRMRQIIGFIWNHVLTDPRPTWIVVDEAWNWLQHPLAAADLEEIARRFRKRYGALVLATQHVSDLSASAGAQVIRDTAGVTVLFRQKSASAAAAGQLFRLNEVEVEELVTQGPGEGLLIAKGRRIPIYVPVPPNLMRRFTTNPKDRQRLAEGGDVS